MRRGDDLRGTRMDRVPEYADLPGMVGGTEAA